MVALGKVAQWPRSDIRAMTPEEFLGYMEAAEAVEVGVSGSAAYG